MENLMTILPQEININILSRLPVPTVMICKCVCKSWRNLLESLEFANSHLSKSVPGLVAQKLFTGHLCQVLGFNPRCNISFSFCLPRPSLVKSSVDGLLCMMTASKKKHLLYICNPVTREYITLPHPPGCPPYNGLFHGFGVSKITRQYKLVMVAYSCEIYTLGTGCWRRIPVDRLHLYTENEPDQAGVFLNGNLHWLATDCSGTKLQIRCLDLETERFSTLSLLSSHFEYAHKSLTAWGGRLYFLGRDDVDGEIAVWSVWSMKEYGDEKSWTRDLVIEQRSRRNFCPIKVFKDGDFLLSVGYDGELVYFSTTTTDIRTIHLPGLFVDYYTLLTNLPQELIIEILSRLPIPTIMSSKRVCKSWRNMMESLEFANSHLSKSAPALVAQQLSQYQGFKVFEFNPSWNVSFSFCFPHRVLLKSSVDGLLFMIKDSQRRKRLYICNPMNREYIRLPRPAGCAGGIFGFGVSKRTRQYKLVMIARSCHIYTLGTGCWRSIPTESHLFEPGQTGVFLKGNLHWLASDCSGTKLEIRCLDLETELFSTFSLLSPQLGYTCKTLTALGDHLFFLGGYSDAPPAVIYVWSMKAYGDEKSWTRVLAFKQRSRRNFSPTKVFKDDDFWLSVGYGDELVCFSTKTNTVRVIKLPGLFVNLWTHTAAYTPSFLPVLKTFVRKNWLPKLISNILENKFNREDPFNNLPPEIITEILRRLSFQSITSFRCVCKPWFSHTERPDFLMYYFQKSSFPGGLALFKDEMSSKTLRFLEFVDEGYSAHSCRVVLSISLPTHSS